MSMDKKKFYDFLIHQERKEYDMPQAIKSALDALDKVSVMGNWKPQTPFPMLMRLKSLPSICALLHYSETTTFN
ncbi:MAG: hypothetical protein A4E63_03350 [Syntrophorhabdus sp. PtaU1.Bin050]|nr:MAG: hypothetical protein A4E63_03350 [Syntrophorhabdus sp. PtaU1.Bin050]